MVIYLMKYEPQPRPQRSTLDCSYSNPFAYYPFRTLASHFKATVSSNPFEIKRFRTLCKIPGIGYPPPSLFLDRHSIPSPLFPAAHPISLQPLTKCSSRNSFVLITIHFHGGYIPPSALLRRDPGTPGEGPPLQKPQRNAGDTPRGPEQARSGRMKSACCRYSKGRDGSLALFVAAAQTDDSIGPLGSDYPPSFGRFWQCAWPRALPQYVRRAEEIRFRARRARAGRAPHPSALSVYRHGRDHGPRLRSAS
jgi:hypothetical protein